MANLKGMKWLIAATACFAALGCGTPYVVVEGLPGPLEDTESCRIGAIDLRLSDDIPVDKQPSEFLINAMRNELVEEVMLSNVFQHVGTNIANPKYEINGSLRRFTEAQVSGADDHVRKGRIETVMELQLTDTESGTRLFLMRFEGLNLDGNFFRLGAPFTSGGRWAPGEFPSERIAKDFVSELRRQLRIQGQS